jgi:hypothetical protein
MIRGTQILLSEPPYLRHNDQNLRNQYDNILEENKIKKLVVLYGQYPVYVPHDSEGNPYKTTANGSTNLEIRIFNGENRSLEYTGFIGSQATSFSVPPTSLDVNRLVSWMKDEQNNLEVTGVPPWRRSPGRFPNFWNPQVPEETFLLIDFEESFRVNALAGPGPERDLFIESVNRLKQEFGSNLKISWYAAPTVPDSFTRIITEHRTALEYAGIDPNDTLFNQSERATWYEIYIKFGQEATDKIIEFYALQQIDVVDCLDWVSPTFYPRFSNNAYPSAENTSQEPFPKNTKQFNTQREKFRFYANCNVAKNTIKYGQNKTKEIYPLITFDVLGGSGHFADWQMRWNIDANYFSQEPISGQKWAYAYRNTNDELVPFTPGATCTNGYGSFNCIYFNDVNAYSGRMQVIDSGQTATIGGIANVRLVIPVIDFIDKGRQKDIKELEDEIIDVGIKNGIKGFAIWQSFAHSAIPVLVDSESGSTDPRTRRTRAWSMGSSLLEVDYVQLYAEKQRFHLTDSEIGPYIEEKYGIQNNWTWGSSELKQFLYKHSSDFFIQKIKEMNKQIIQSKLKYSAKESNLKAILNFLLEKINTGSGPTEAGIEQKLEELQQILDSDYVLSFEEIQEGIIDAEINDEDI